MCNSVQIHVVGYLSYLLLVAEKKFSIHTMGIVWFIIGSINGIDFH